MLAVTQNGKAWDMRGGRSGVPQAAWAEDSTPGSPCEARHLGGKAGDQVRKVHCEHVATMSANLALALLFFAPITLETAAGTAACLPGCGLLRARLGNKT